MDRDLHLLLAVSPLLVETLILWLRPTWLVLVPMWVVAEKRFTLRRSRRVESGEGYRDAVGVPAMPALPERVELETSVLFADGARVALRRAFGFGRRESWLIRIDVAREGDEIALLARQSLSPITLALTAPILGWIAGRGSPAIALGFSAMIVLVYAAQLGFSTGRRREACEQAFERLEAELRDGLEERR